MWIESRDNVKCDKVKSNNVKCEKNIRSNKPQRKNDACNDKKIKKIEL